MEEGVQVTHFVPVKLKKDSFIPRTVSRAYNPEPESISKKIVGKFEQIKRNNQALLHPHPSTTDQASIQRQIEGRRRLTNSSNALASILKRNNSPSLCADAENTPLPNPSIIQCKNGANLIQQTSEDTRGASNLKQNSARMSSAIFKGNYDGTINCLPAQYSLLSERCAASNTVHRTNSSIGFLIPTLESGTGLTDLEYLASKFPADIGCIMLEEAKNKVFAKARIHEEKRKVHEQAQELLGLMKEGITRFEQKLCNFLDNELANFEKAYDEFCVKARRIHEYEQYKRMEMFPSAEDMFRAKQRDSSPVTILTERVRGKGGAGHFNCRPSSSTDAMMEDLISIEKEYKVKLAELGSRRYQDYLDELRGLIAPVHHMLDNRKAIINQDQLKQRFASILKEMTILVAAPVIAPSIQDVKLAVSAINTKASLGIIHTEPAVEFQAPTTSIFLGMGSEYAEINQAPGLLKSLSMKRLYAAPIGEKNMAFTEE